MACMAGCEHHVVVAGFAAIPTSRASRAMSSATASSSSKGCPKVAISATSQSRKFISRRNDRLGGCISSSSLAGLQFSVGCRNGTSRVGGEWRTGVVGVRAYKSTSDVVGVDPSWDESDFVVVGLAHCFKKDENSKLIDSFVIEPIPAGGLECMDNGGMTCYKHAARTNLGAAMRMDASVFPKEFAKAEFCDNFKFRTLCASRTWKRDHAREHLMDLLPGPDSVRSDWNFSLQDKRILNQENVVNDSDNIKQDLSIDVYGRTDKEETMTAEIGQLYDV